VSGARGSQAGTSPQVVFCWTKRVFSDGDVATIDRYGYVRIVDRAKDVIKSGGEWISSIELEQLALKHAGVAAAAVIGVPHPKWEERPVLIVVPAPGRSIDANAIRDAIRPYVAKWWLPDAVFLVKELPLTATGKIDKRTLREQYRGLRSCDADATVSPAATE
jgi:fatty-acyl-CoA synthase